jgi:DNA-binding transcriptional regulator GbsR (MarR family)
VPFTQLKHIPYPYTGPPMLPPTAEVKVETLDANPYVQKIVAALQHRQMYDAVELATKLGVSLTQLSPVLKAMQQARMIEVGRYVHGSRINHYRLKT